jgi:triacylglycerol lipase
MVPLSLLFWLALEVSTYLALGRLALGLDWGYAIAGTVGLVLGVRANINAITWMFGMAFASPAPRLGFARTAGLIWRDYLAFLFTFLLVLPLERLWMPADRLKSGGRVVLFVHGYGCSRGVWWKLRRRFEAAGYTVASVSLVPPYASMGRMVPLLSRRIEEVCAATGAAQLTLIAHSMGGLVCRSYLARHGGTRVARLLTVATPHQGSALSRLGFGQNAREMTPGSLWLQDMAGEKIGVPVVSLRNPYDNYVMPQDNQRLPGARDVELPPTGHLALLYDRRTADLLLEVCADTGSHR